MRRGGASEQLASAEHGCRSSCGQRTATAGLTLDPGNVLPLCTIGSACCCIQMDLPSLRIGVLMWNTNMPAAPASAPDATSTVITSIGTIVTL